MLCKAFTETKMSWKRVILLSLVCGVIVGALMIPGSLQDTSLQRPGITFEFWIFAALYIILNCEKPVEAGLKTFVFFLISQPIIYLVQVPFASLHWQIFSYYPYWAKITLLTLPGGMIAWFTKKGNVLSAIILSVANLLIMYMLPPVFRSMLNGFPRYLLAVLFMVFEVVFFILLLMKTKKAKVVAIVLAVLLLAFGIWYDWYETSADAGEFSTLLDGEAPFSVVSDTGDAEVTVDGNKLTVNAGYFMGFPIDLVDAEGNSFTVFFDYNENGVSWKTE